MATTPLTRGHCHFLAGGVCSTRNRRRKQSERWPCVGSLLLVLVEQGLFLCRMDRTVGIPSTSISNCDAQLFFLWSHTVKVATTSLVRPRAVVEEILSNGAAIPAFNLTKLTTNPSRSQAQLLPIEPKENGLNFVSTFSEQAAVAVSVVFRRSAPKELGTSRISRAPIQMANLKRQLVGIHVLYREAHFTTMVSISLEGETYELCVERIAYQPTVSDVRIVSCALQYIISSRRFACYSSS